MFAKIGVEHVGSDSATFVRTIVVLLVLAMILFVTRGWQSPISVAGRTYTFLLLSGLATGAWWLCYFRALKLGDAASVAPIDKLSVVLWLSSVSSSSVSVCPVQTGQAWR
jgi:bacterial/archaeal transporter family protein